MNYTLTIIIFCILLFIYYINQLNIENSIKDTIKINIFNGISILFLLIFIYYSIFYNIKKGFFNTLIIWCIFVTATPIPEAGLLVSVPLKNILNIDLDNTQLFVSLFALIIIFYSYYNFRSYLKGNKSGEFLIKIIDLGSFSIFITSIIASIALANIFNDIIDFIFMNKELNYQKNLYIFIIFIIPFLLYFYFLSNLLKNKY